MRDWFTKSTPRSNCRRDTTSCAVRSSTPRERFAASRTKRYSRLPIRAKRAIEAHRAERIARQLSTEPADRERVERGIAACYRFAGYEPPQRILWIDSPAGIAAGPLAAAIIEHWTLGPFVPRGGRLGREIEDRVRSRARGTVAEIVIELLRTTAASELEPATPNEAEARDYAVGLNYTIALRDACGNDVTRRIRAATAARLYGRLTDELEHRDRAARNPSVSAAVEARMRTDDSHQWIENRIRRSRLARVLRLGWSDVLYGRAGGTHEGDTCVTSFFRDVVGCAAIAIPEEMWQRSRAFEDMSSAGELWPHRRFCIVTHPPVELHVERIVDENGGVRWWLHNEAGPAVVWRDGSAQWYLHDRFVDGVSASAKPPTFRRTVDRITQMFNAEQRRKFVEMYGRNRYLRDAGAVRIDAEHAPAAGEWTAPCDVRYRALWRLEQPFEEPIVMIDVINQSPEPFGHPADGEAYLAIGGRTWKRYMLRVPPTMTTCAEAVAWTFGKTVDAYRPHVES